MANIDWNTYFLGLAKLSALRSKDPNTKVGAAIVNPDKRIIALGYNGMPKGDDSFPWISKGDSREQTKYAYVVHAEVNAILNSTASVKDSLLYVTLFPCSECAKLVAQSGIKKIFYTSDKYENTEDNLISKRTLKQLGIEIEKLDDFEIDIKR